MKLISIFFVVGLLFMVLSLNAQEQVQEQESPFSSVMNMKCIDALQFQSYFQYDKKELKVMPSGNFIELTGEHGFKLGNQVINSISFMFISDDKALKFEPKNYAYFKLKNVFFRLAPNQFEAIFDVFKAKYGEPVEVKTSEIQNKVGTKFEQKIVVWIKDGKRIYLHRYPDKVDVATAFFCPDDKANPKIVDGR